MSQLEQDLGNKVSAVVRSSPKAPEWIYPTAYHIKVAVRDSSSFWLSSGNWNNSNQPDIDPFKNKAAAGPIAKKIDRDWHIIVNHKELAQTYEALLKNDFAVASDAESGPTPMALAEEALAAAPSEADLSDVGARQQWRARCRASISSRVDSGHQHQVDQDSAHLDA
jgi:hypothetical protein